MAKRAPTQRGAHRAVRRTVLFVGEGDAEEVLLRHLRKLYTAGNEGFRASIKNAHGKGAGHVVDCAIRAYANADFDRCAVLLDTDEGWTDAVRRRARTMSIQVIESNPCCEAWLLDIAGHGGERRSSEHKREFQRRFGASAHHVGVYTMHFARSILDAARPRVPTLDQLLAGFGV